MVSSVFVGWDVAHIVSALFLYFASLATFVYGMMRAVIAYKAMRFVDTVKTWNACEDRDYVSFHLCIILWNMVIWSSIILMIVLFDIVYDWVSLPHAAHIIHYIIWIGTCFILWWGKRSTQHFKQMSQCSGNLEFHAKKNGIASFSD